MNNIKHLIITRFLCQEIHLSKEQLFDDRLLEYGYNLLQNHLIKSLESQSCKDFELVIMIHDDIDCNKPVISKLMAIRQSFNVTIIRSSYMKDYIKKFYKTNDYVIVSRIDYDDRVRFDQVQAMQNLIGDGDFVMHIIGYHNGYKYYEQSGQFYYYTGKFPDGFVSMFATVIYNTKFNKYRSIYCNHTKIIAKFQEFFVTKFGDCSGLRITDIEDRCFIYTRHDHNDSSIVKNEKILDKNLVDVTSTIQKEFGYEK